MRAEGKASEAEGCERRAELVTKRTELERHKVELEAQRAELDAKQMAEMRVLQEQIERAAEVGRAAERDAVMRAEADRQRAEDMLPASRHALEADALEKRARGADADLRAPRDRRASEEFARALAAQIDAWKRELERNPSARPALEPEIRRFDAALKALEAKPQP
jgi:phenylalanyl-tRNA synthetase alpha subunit